MSGSESGAHAAPRPLLAYAGPELFTGQPARQVPLPSATAGCLGTFTLDFWFRPKEANFHSCGHSELSPRQIPLAVHFSKGCGFRLDLCEAELMLKLGSGAICPTSGNMRPGACTHVPVEFPGGLRADKWSRVTVIVDCSRARQLARLYLDAELTATVTIPRERMYIQSDMPAVLVGSEDFRGEVESVRLFSGVVHPKDMGALVARRSPDQVASSHLGKLAASVWSSMSFADCEISAEQGGCWPAHRCILAAGSPVLQRMLEGGMQEAQQGARTRIAVRGAADPDVEALLRFLYTGRLPDAGEAAGWSLIGALVLADMYDVQDMVQLAVSELEAGLCEENVVEVVRVLGKRKAAAPLGAAYKRVCARVREHDGLHARCMDSL